MADGAVQVAPARRVALGYIALAARADAVALGTHRAAIGAYAKAHNLDLTTVVHDVPRRPGASDGRPALRWALGRIAAGEAQVLVVAQLAHLSDTVADLSPLLRWFATDGRALVVVDIRLDTSTQAGRLAATALDGVGGLDRIQAAPEPSSVGAASPPRRPAPRRAAVADLPDLQLRIAALREQGMTLQAIADLLNEEGVPTVRGGTMWRASSVQRATGYQRPPRARRGIEVPRARPE